MSVVSLVSLVSLVSAVSAGSVIGVVGMWLVRPVWHVRVQCVGLFWQRAPKPPPPPMPDTLQALPATSCLLW